MGKRAACLCTPTPRFIGLYSCARWCGSWWRGRKAEGATAAPVLETLCSERPLSVSPAPATSRSASPKHGFTIMNRLSMENRTEPITKDLDFLLQDPFLLYRNARCESARVRDRGDGCGVWCPWLGSARVAWEVQCDWRCECLKLVLHSWAALCVSPSGAGEVSPGPRDHRGPWLAIELVGPCGWASNGMLEGGGLSSRSTVFWLHSKWTLKSNEVLLLRTS